MRVLVVSRRNLVIVKVAVFGASLFTLAMLAEEYFTHTFGANPVEEITHATGDSALVFLLLTLGVTPLRKISGQPWLINFRRMLGLFAFFYGSLHLLTFLWLDKAFDYHEIIKDVVKRAFITAGFAGWLLMLPLALTSTRWSIGRMGGRRWQLLHRLIYFSAIAGVVHYYWLVKRDVTDPVIYAVILGALLLYRVLAPFTARLNGGNSRKTSPQIG